MRKWEDGNENERGLPAPSSTNPRRSRSWKPRGDGFQTVWINKDPARVESRGPPALIPAISPYFYSFHVQYLSQWMHLLSETRPNSKEMSLIHNAWNPLRHANRILHLTRPTRNSNWNVMPNPTYRIWRIQTQKMANSYIWKEKKKKALLRKSEGTCMSGHTIPPWQRRKLG